jgi:hypothetical protein
MMNIFFSSMIDLDMNHGREVYDKSKSVDRLKISKILVF